MPLNLSLPGCRPQTGGSVPTPNIFGICMFIFGGGPRGKCSIPRKNRIPASFVLLLLQLVFSTAMIADRRPPSPLGDIQPDHWLAEYTTDLLDVLHVLGRLVELEPLQAAMLERICAAPLLSADELREGGAFVIPADLPNYPSTIAEAQETAQTPLFDTTHSKPATSGTKRR